jgi:hypothetical protein
MNHKRYDEFIYLYIYGELRKKDLIEFETHIKKCVKCQEEINELKLLMGLLNNYEYFQADDKLLEEARSELSRSLDTEKAKPLLWDRLSEFIYNVFPNYKLALGGIVLIVIGFFAGYLFTHSTKYEVQSTPVSTPIVTSFGEPLSPSPRIANVRFINTDDRSGEVELTFDAVMPVRLKGRMDEPNVQKILATALMTEQNPGIRLQSVNAITIDDHISKLDDELLDALISAVRYDKNTGVRREALMALQPYEADRRVRGALFDVLAHDESAGLRITAINILTNWNKENFYGDSLLVKLLKLKITNDSSNYIRMRSHAFLKEIQP